MVLYSTLAEGICRLVLRIVTITMFFLLPFIGDKCCELRNQLKLLRNQDVTVTSMTGWVKGPSSLITAFRIRRLPAGLLGLLMILAAALALITDLVVARFVNTIPWSTRCSFETGMVADGRGSVSTFPPYNSKAYAMASTAQLSSIDNGGNSGIYNKVNSDFSFQAQDQDTIGTWNCTANGTIRQYNTTAMTDIQIIGDLINKSLIYDNWYYGNTSQGVTPTGLPSNESWQLLIMSFSARAPGTDFTIKMAIDIEDVYDDKAERIVKKGLQLYDCDLRPNAGFESVAHTVLSGIDPTHVGATWLDPIKGNLYDSLTDYTVTEYAQARVVWMLNSLVMVAGSDTKTASTLDGSDYGCVIAVTEVPNVVIIFVALSGMITVLLGLVAIILAIKVFRASRKYDRENRGNRLSSKDLKESVPNGLVGWMVHAAQESNRSTDRPDERGLTNWRLSSRNFDNHRLTMVRARHSDSEAEPMQQHQQHQHQPLNHGMPTQDYGYPTYTQNSTAFMGHKTGYTSVNTRDNH